LAPFVDEAHQSDRSVADMGCDPGDTVECAFRRSVENFELTQRSKTINLVPAGSIAAQDHVVHRGLLFLMF
jgi:hypothetical protein